MMPLGEIFSLFFMMPLGEIFSLFFIVSPVIMKTYILAPFNPGHKLPLRHATLSDPVPYHLSFRAAQRLHQRQARQIEKCFKATHFVLGAQLANGAAAFHCGGCQAV